MTTTPKIIGIGGTVRSGSSTEMAVRFSLGICEQIGAMTNFFGGAELAGLPHYAPESRERTGDAYRLVDELRCADGVIIGSPSYHGSISGLVKNALDYTEDLREDIRPYLSGRPVGCIVTGAGWQGIVTTLQTLRSIAHALRGWATPLGATINTIGPVFTPEGDCSEDKVRHHLMIVAQEVMDFAAWHIGGVAPDWVGTTE